MRREPRGPRGDLRPPIVRDHAWFWLGVAPQLERRELVRTVSSRIDCGAPRPGAGPDDCAPATCKRNPYFGRVTNRYSPASAEVGARIRF